jgi:hypothetical protein
LEKATGKSVIAGGYSTSSVPGAFTNHQSPITNHQSPITFSPIPGLLLPSRL